MNNALLYLGGILITALAVLFAVPRFIDWNSYRGVFEEEASRILGREVRVGGAVNVRLLPAPYVAFEKLRIADIGDEAGGGGHSIIRVESFTMWLSVPPLLRGVLEAHKVELRRPVLHLAINSTGSGNWRTLAVTPGAFPFAPKDVALQSVAIDDGAIIVSSPARGELARFDAIRGELTAEALEGPFKFRGDVNWGGAPRHVRLGTAKLDPNGDLRFKAAVDVVGSANAYVLDGRLSDLKGSPKLDGELTAKLALAPGSKIAPGGVDAAFESPAAPAADLAVDPDLPAQEAGDVHVGLDQEPAAAAPEPETAAEAPPPADAPGPAAAPPAAPAAPADVGNGPSGGFELKAKVEGTTLGLALTDIAVSLEAGAAPQLITGEAKFDWADKTRLDVALKSRWLDLDQIGRATQAKMPLEAGRSYFEALASALPAEADTNAELEFDQLTLGGEPIGNVRLAASRSGGPLELKGVRADLPGGVRLELEGILTPTGDVPHLDGSLFASGKSLMRFLAWGVGNPGMARERGDGPFSLDGRFALGDGTLALTDAAFKFAGTPLTGDLKLDLGAQRKLALAVEGLRIDAAQIGSGVVSLKGLTDLVLGTRAGAAPAAEGAEADADAAPFDPAAADLSLDLKVAELVDGDRVLNDVDAVVRLERGMLAIPRLRFSTPEGLSVEAEGEARDVPDRPQGAIRGLIAAPNARAARALIALLGGDGTEAADLDRLAGLAPLRLAGTLKLAGGATNASALTLDGTLGGGRLTAALRLDGGRSQWRTQPLDVEAALDSPDVARLVAALFDARIKADPAAAPTGGRAVLKATGVPAEGLLALADVTADGLTLGYRGQVRLPAPGETGLDGTLQVAAADARLALALAGLAPAEGAAGIPLGGTVHVQRKGRVLKLDGEALALGDSTVSGQVSLTAQDGGRQTVEAKLKASKASLASLLAPILGAADGAPTLDDAAAAPAEQAGRGPARHQAAAAPDEGEPATVIWPEQPFDLALLSRLDGKIEIALDALAVEPGLTLSNALIEAVLTPETIKVARLEGDAVGGRLTSQLDFEKAPAGVGLSGSLRIDIAGKPAPGGGASSESPPPPGDVAAFAVNFTSRALSPAAVISALTGKGELTVGDATLNGNSPAAVSTVARAALTGQGPSGGTALTDAIRESLKEGEVRLGKLTIPVEISDGALKLEKVRIDMADGRSTFVTAVELATMKIDSEWQIEPKLDKPLSATPARAHLPPVTVVYAGKLSQLASLVPMISADALERELVVRKMELDVGELERLRKLDQERARQDAERRRALEEDQATPPPPPPQPAPPPQARPDAVEREDLGAPPPGPQGAGDGASGVYGDSVVDAPEGVPIEQDIEAAAPPPAVAPSPTSQRPPPRRKTPADEAWRPFQTPY